MEMQRADIQLLLLIDSSEANGAFFKAILETYLVPFLKLMRKKPHGSSAFSVIQFSSSNSGDTVTNKYSFILDPNTFYKTLQKLEFKGRFRRGAVFNALLDSVDMLDDREALLQSVSGRQAVCSRYVFLISSCLPELWSPYTFSSSGKYDGLSISELSSVLAQKNVKLSLMSSRPIKELSEFYEKVRHKSVPLEEHVDSNLYIFKMADLEISSILKSSPHAGSLPSSSTTMSSHNVSASRGQSSQQQPLPQHQHQHPPSQLKQVLKTHLSIVIMKKEHTVPVIVVSGDRIFESDLMINIWPQKLQLLPTRLGVTEFGNIARLNKASCSIVQIRPESPNSEGFKTIGNLIQQSGKVAVAKFNNQNQGLVMFMSKGALIGIVFVKIPIPSAIIH